MKNIYLDVKANVENLQNIFKNTDNENERLKKSNQEALEVFQKLEFESLKELESLKNNGEWENFTIAFYGETGAGKSTLIECLRLFFKEPGKRDQQERFRQLYSNYVKNHRGSGHALLELEKFQDGATIGDGRSDFTLETKSYTLKHNNKTFTLLDVPWIEGDEKKVIQQISNATQKAHAIFYVTKKPTPPQKGEEKKEGTIEKIQKQLGSQTEVWTIFNKPINNPRVFKDGLIDGNEKESLKILNKEMKNILGKHHKGHKVVSAQAAFYGLAQALIPETDFYEKKQKFLKDFKAGELLYQSHFKLLGEFIAEELLKNSRAKIIESNCNKALKVVEQLQEAIEITIEKRIDPMIKEAQEHQQEARYNLNRSTEKFILNLTNSAFYKIDQFKSDLREKMYAHIDLGVEHWLKHQEEFQKLSHIKALQDATQKKIKENGGKLTIIEEAKKSVIQDVIHRQMPLAKKEQQEIKREMEYLNRMIEKRRKDLQNLNSEISQARIHLREFITRYFSDLIRQVSGTSLETFNDFVIREIGDEGINIETRVQNAFERETQGIFNEISKIETGFNADMSLFEKHAGALGKIGINLLNQSGFINATNIKLARDALVATGKFVGMDLAFKFKPWGAVKLAGNLNKGLPFIGLAFEVWDSWKESQKIEKLEKAKGEMKSNFDGQKQEILDLINDETRFKQTCFPNALELEECIQACEESIKKTQECTQGLEKWIRTGEDFIKGEDFIDVEPEEE